MTVESCKVKDVIYASDNEFRILQLDHGRQWLADASGLDKTKWEVFRFDVWNEKFIGWLDIFIGRDGDSSWHFFERDPNDPSKGVLVYYAPMKVDPRPAARHGIFEDVCENIKTCHDWTISQTNDNLEWKQPTDPVVARVFEEQVS